MERILKAWLAVGLGLGIQAAGAQEVLPDKPPIPDDNPMTEAKIRLGKQLYFDPRLSSTGAISCNSCHNLMAGGDDSRGGSVGVEGQVGGRSAPTVWNAAFMTTQFWDGRAPSLEKQAQGPFLNPVEMGMSSGEAVAERVRSVPGYRNQFKAVFGGDHPVTYENISKAIAAFERTLLTPNSPVDQYLKGNKSALSESAQRGVKLVNDVGCTSCHTGPIYAGPGSMPMGQGFFQKFPTYTDNKYVDKYHLMEDKGRYEATGEESDKHLWKVPTWRNVAVTPPYFHNGSVVSLDEAVRVMAKTQLNKELSDQQVKDIVAFLNGLTGEFPEITIPRLPPLPPEEVKALTTAKD